MSVIVIMDAHLLCKEGLWKRAYLKPMVSVGTVWRQGGAAAYMPARSN